MMRPRLEYVAVVWFLSPIKDIRRLEWIQKIATKIVPELNDLAYEEQLKKMELLTIQGEKEQGDLIKIYKIVNGIEKVDKED
ncbi:hypothetical protein E2C01_077846 [Portunus trituberculatus]|uniref:Uncharacterized protein n=1 Tax=Portunus trituberculatus TaxID=210409 RepID=A0A5B7IFI0_PORTR|nr:hypothetical protein [Portunus trituberculatus]